MLKAHTDLCVINRTINMVHGKPVAPYKLRYLLIEAVPRHQHTCQYALVKLLTGVRGMFTAVGDDDQSIYAWRGADIENLNRLHTDFPR